MSQKHTIQVKGKKIDTKTVYKDWRRLVNMSLGELRRYYDSKDGKQSGLSRAEAKRQGINRGRQSARWIMKMKPLGRSLSSAKKNWTPTMWWWADKQVRFIKRMKGVKGALTKDGKRTPKYKALLIWGHNPKK